MYYLIFFQMFARTSKGLINQQMRKLQNRNDAEYTTLVQNFFRDILSPNSSNVQTFWEQLYQKSYGKFFDHRLILNDSEMDSQSTEEEVKRTFEKNNFGRQQIEDFVHRTYALIGVEYDLKSSNIKQVNSSNCNSLQ